MNGPMASPFPANSRPARACGKEDNQTLRRHCDNQSIIWQKDPGPIRQALLHIRHFAGRLCSALSKPRAHEGYYAIIENLGLTRAKALFIIMAALAAGRCSFNVTAYVLDNPPSVVSQAQAGKW